MNGRDARFGFAVPAGGGLCSIAEAVEARASGRDRGPFVCPGCGDGMVIVAGKVRVHHFRHLVSECRRETYLHRAAKFAVVEGFARAEAKGEEYPLLYVEGVGADIPRRVDLRKRFSKVGLEKGVGGFVADVLFSDDADGVLLVEACVTHECEPAKAASGLPIAEVRVQDETDVARLLWAVDLTRPGCRYFGFRSSSAARRAAAEAERAAFREAEAERRRRREVYSEPERRAFMASWRGKVWLLRRKADEARERAGFFRPGPFEDAPPLDGELMRRAEAFDEAADKLEAESLAAEEAAAVIWEPPLAERIARQVGWRRALRLRTETRFLSGGE